MKYKLLLLTLLPACCFGQNVGIGITPTKAKLEVNGAVGNTVAIFGGDTTGVSFQQNPAAIGFNRYNATANKVMKNGASVVKWLDMSNGNLAFDIYDYTTTTGTTPTPLRALTIQQNGNVALGPANNSSLFVAYTSDLLTTAIFRGTQHQTIFSKRGDFPGFIHHTYINAGKTGSIVYLNDISSGNVLVGNGTGKLGINIDPTDLLHVKQVNGRGLALINANFNYWETFVEKNLVENQSDLYLYYNGGNLGNFYNGDGHWYYYSDQRMKSNIETIANVLPKVMALRPSTYRFKQYTTGQGKSIGLIAQEVEKIFPELTEHVISNELGYPDMNDLYTINYSAISPIAVKAIQEQQEKIKKLKEQVELLRQRITAAEKIAAESRTAATSNN